MEMTKQEIVKSYKESGQKRAQIKILADLNGVTSKEIIEVLKAAGLAIPIKTYKKAEKPINTQCEESKEEVKEEPKELPEIEPVEEEIEEVEETFPEELPVSVWTILRRAIKDLDSEIEKMMRERDEIENYITEHMP